MDDDARILPQFPGELRAADINGVNPDCAARQQHVGETAGRGADIERERAAGIGGEMVEREGKLQPAARYPGMVAAGERERGVLVERCAGLVDPAASGTDEAGQDQRLRLGPAFREPLLDQQLVGPALRRWLPLGR